MGGELPALLRQGIAAAKAGDQETARRILTYITKQEPQNEQAWLWLSGVVESPEEKRACLQRVLVINPHNMHARRGLEWLAVQLLRERAASEEPVVAAEPEELSVLDMPPDVARQRAAPPGPGGLAGVLDGWGAMLLFPGVRIFRAELERAKGVWTAVGLLVAGLFPALAFALVGSGLGTFELTDPGFMRRLGLVLLGSEVGTLFDFYILYALPLYVPARLMGSRCRFADHSYLLGLVFCVLEVVGSMLLTPFLLFEGLGLLQTAALGGVSLLLWLYSLLLAARALSAAHGFSTRRAVWALVLGHVWMFVVAAVLFGAVAALARPFASFLPTLLLPHGG